MKRLISITLISVATVVCLAQSTLQNLEINKPVVGVLGGQLVQPITLPANGTGSAIVTNSTVSSFAPNGMTPPGEGLAFPIFGTMFTTSVTNEIVLTSTITGSSPNAGFSIKQLQGRTYPGSAWQNVLVVSNALPVATNTITTNLLIPAATFFGYSEGRVFSIQNASTNGATTNTCTETDYVHYYH